MGNKKKMNVLLSLIALFKPKMENNNDRIEIETHTDKIDKVDVVVEI